MPEIDQRNLPSEVLARLADNFGTEFMAARHRGFDISYRGQVLEHRAHRGVEVRTDAATDSPIIQGYATVYDHAYEVMGGAASGYGWDETIVRGAADKSVSERDDVYLFFDHEGLPLAATKATNATRGLLTLVSDKIGLYNESRIDPRDDYSMSIVRRLEDGLLDAQSFAFRAVRQEWNDDYTERFITEVKLYDVSVVSFPANPATVAQVRADTPVPAEVGMPLALALALADASRARVA